MLYVVGIARIPVWLIGACIGGWLLTHGYMRMAWLLLSREVNDSGEQ